MAISKQSAQAVQELDCCGVGGAALLWAGDGGCVRPVAAFPAAAGA